MLYLHDLKRHLDRMLIREGRMELAQTCFNFLPTRIALDLAGLGRDGHLRAQLMAIALTETADQRRRIYRALRAAQPLVGVLRFLVPGIGVAVFARARGRRW